MNEYCTPTRSGQRIGKREPEIKQETEWDTRYRVFTPVGIPRSPQNSTQTRYGDSRFPVEALTQLSLSSPISQYPSQYSSQVSRPLTHCYFRDCSDEQNRVFSLVAKRENVFFTGSAGVGKSFVIRKIREILKFAGMIEFQDFFVTASTGSYILYVTVLME
jgi:hypothetical protein